MKSSSPRFRNRRSLLLAAALLPGLAGAQAPAPEPPYQLEKMVVTPLAPPIVKEADIPLLEPRFGAAVVAKGDFLYVIGGSNSEGTRLDSVERIDLRSGRTTLWTRLRIARRHHRSVIEGGKIYVLGGTSGPVAQDNPLSEELADYHGDDEPSGFQPPTPPIKSGGYRHERSMEIIDLATGGVALGPEMPFAKALFGCVVVAGRILVIGGQKRRGDAVSSTNTTEYFDLATRQWNPGVNMPTPRRCTATIVDGFVLVVGGFRGSRALPTVEAFNPRDGGWRRLPDVIESVNPSSAVWVGHHLLLFGDQKTRQRQVVYDLSTKQLATYPLPLPEADFAAALEHEGKIYVVGGASLRLHQSNPGIQVFTPSLQPAPSTGATR